VIVRSSLLEEAHTHGPVEAGGIRDITTLAAAPSVPLPASPRRPARCYPRAQTARPPPGAPARAAAVQRACTRHVAHTACHRHTTAPARRHYIE
jgi:hypothetical protein